MHLRDYLITVLFLTGQTGAFPAASPGLTGSSSVVQNAKAISTAQAHPDVQTDGDALSPLTALSEKLPFASTTAERLSAEASQTTQDSIMSKDAPAEESTSLPTVRLPGALTTADAA